MPLEICCLRTGSLIGKKHYFKMGWYLVAANWNYSFQLIMLLVLIGHYLSGVVLDNCLSKYLNCNCTHYSSFAVWETISKDVHFQPWCCYYIYYCTSHTSTACNLTFTKVFFLVTCKWDRSCTFLSTSRKCQHILLTFKLKNPINSY